MLGIANWQHRFSLKAEKRKRLFHNHQKDKEKNRNIKQLLSILQIQMVIHQHLLKKRSKCHPAKINQRKN